MKRYELLPTKENLLSTYEENAIGRNGDIYSFIKLLNNIEAPYSIALDGKWGTGKTFFVKQLKMVLDSLNDLIDTDSEVREKVKSVCKKEKQFECSVTPFVTVYYDAWENDSDDDPILSLIFNILKESDQFIDFGNKTNLLDLASSIFEFFTKRDPKKIIDSLNSNDALKTIQKSKSIEAMINEFFADLLPERGDTLLIIIDELDRCNPTFAVKLLERIKHYFSNDRIIFLFSTNLTELQHTINKLYGERFDACKYLERFFDFFISLPKPNLDYYFIRLDFGDLYVYDIIRKAIITKYKLSLREISKYYSISEAAAAQIARNKNERFRYFGSKALDFCVMYITPIMIYLKMFDREKYSEFTSGNDYSPIMELSDYIHIEHNSDFLDDHESYVDTDKEGYTVITKEDKLKQIYDAVFSTELSKTQSVSVGKVDFYKETKDELMKIENLISKYSNYSFDKENYDGQS